MAKKDFSNITHGRVFESITQATQEAPQEQSAHDTQAAPIAHRKQKRARINMAFDDDVFEYITTMGGMHGISTTEFCNRVLRKHMQDNAEQYERSKAFRKTLE